MGSPGKRSLTRPSGRRLTAWAALAIGWVLPTTGCQVEYAGMTLPSGKYMHDDVQYFSPGPSFPWANTQAATQRARMQQMGIEAPPAPGAAGPFSITQPPGALDPNQPAQNAADPRTGDGPIPGKPVEPATPVPIGQPVPPPAGAAP